MVRGAIAKFINIYVLCFPMIQTTPLISLHYPTNQFILSFSSLLFVDILCHQPSSISLHYLHKSKAPPDKVHFIKGGLRMRRSVFGRQLPQYITPFSVIFRILQWGSYTKVTTSRGISKMDIWIRARTITSQVADRWVTRIPLRGGTRDVIPLFLARNLDIERLFRFYQYASNVLSLLDRTRPNSAVTF